ncbi:MAG: hypothetical protein ACKVU1_15055 [bacterium]
MLSNTRAGLFAGVFLISFSILQAELVLTRVFSVTLWYHFAFVAVSVALLGMATGGVRVYRRGAVADAHVPAALAREARRFSVAMVGALLILLGVPFIYRISLGAVVSLVLIYAGVALPFYFGGALLALLFRARAREIGPIYAADLAGAGLGALLTVPLLNAVSAPTALVVAATGGALASVLFARSAGDPGGTAARAARSDTRRGLALAAVFSIVAILGETTPLLRIDFAKDQVERGLLAEKWNALSRITVGPWGTPTWGVSERYKGPKPETLWMKIDSDAGTPITRWDGDVTKVEALRYDITAFAYHFRQGQRSLVIGPGGGRDVLTALIMGARTVTGVEINPAIVETVRDQFGDFTGRLYDDPRVTIVLGEGREYLRRTPERFDMIQASLIDTWAASAAGAYVFSEANLYTREAFGEYLDRLTDEGILTVSRWHFKDLPTETLRMTGLAVRALLDRGVADPAAHIILVKRTTWDWAYRLAEPRDGIGTILVKRTPFRPEEVAHARQLAEGLDFQVILAPGGGGDPLFENLVAGRDPEAFGRSYAVDVSPPTDERPFFFYTLRLRDLPKWLGSQRVEQGVMQNNVRAVFVLGALLLIVLVLSIGFLILPLVSRSDGPREMPPAPALAYFAALGLGFILIEIPLIQRLILYLGHPLYALSVVLSALLIGAGAGSLLCSRLSIAAARRAVVALALVLALASVTIPPVLGATLGAGTAARIGLSVAAIFALGVGCGIPFPLGVRLLGAEGERWIPWMWGINGAFSVLASVLATALAMSFGFGAPFAVGVAAYAVAAVLAFRAPWRVNAAARARA